MVMCSTVSTANLVGENHGLDVIYRLIPQYTTKHLHTIKYVYPGFLRVTQTTHHAYLMVTFDSPWITLTNTE